MIILIKWHIRFLLKRRFNPQTQNWVYTIIKTDDGWLYLAIVMNLFSRQIVSLRFMLFMHQRPDPLIFKNKMYFKIQYIDFN